MPRLDHLCLVAFLRELAREYATCLNVVVLDHAPAHTAYDIAVPENVVLLYLLSYGPELNPVEQLCPDLKAQIDVLDATMRAILEALRHHGAEIIGRYTREERLADRIHLPAQRCRIARILENWYHSMPTSPQETVLGRSFVSENQELEEMLDDLVSLIDEVVNFGTHVFTWCLESGADRNDAILPLILPLRHSLQMFDSMSALVRQASIEPCDFHLRSALESCFTIRYVLQSDTEKQAMAFLVWHAHRRMKLYKKYDPTKEMGKQLASQLEESPVEELGEAVARKFDLDRARSNIKNLLQRDLYRDAEKEYQRLRDEGRSNPSWYQFYDGPDNLEQLARRIGMELWYQTLYRQWSDSVHATKIVRTVTKVDGEAAIRTIRNPLDVETRVTLAVTLALQIYQPMIKNMVPGKSAVYDQWFQREVRDRYMHVAREKLISLDS